MNIEPEPGTTRLRASDVRGIDQFELWLPEGIGTNTGSSSVYPSGGAWSRTGSTLVHESADFALFGEGNLEWVDGNTIAAAGIAFPTDGPVAWRTHVEVAGDEVSFRIELTNTGDAPLRRACAHICYRFRGADWWSDDRVYVAAGGGVRTLASLGMDAGQPNAFQAYLVGAEEFDHPFMKAFWGYNAQRLDAPVLVSEHRDGGLCTGITVERAYICGSNRGNPCTDAMLAFGDLEPGATASASGRVFVADGDGPTVLARSLPG